jgi:TonB family protein
VSSARKLVCVACTFTLALAQAQTPPEVPPELQAASAPAPEPTIVPAKMDPRNPFHIGSDFYPPDSLKAKEEGGCIMSAFIDANGWVLALQVAKSTGIPRLDAACFRAFENGRVLPATRNGVPTAGWMLFRLIWRLSSPASPTPRAFLEMKPFATPQMSGDAPRVSTLNYPQEALAKHQQGNCLVMAKVAADGKIRSADLLKSAGSVSLDNACISAIVLAQFTPQEQEGVAVEGSTMIALYWRLNQ